MERQLEEQADKLQRYESKLKDIIAAYKQLKVEKDALEEKLNAISDNVLDKGQSNYDPQKDLSNAFNRIEDAEATISRLQKQMERKDLELNDQHTTCTELTAKMKILVVENEKFRGDKETILSQKQRLCRLTHELAAEKITSKSLMDALADAQQQHEMSTQNFETRLSEMIATLKSYREMREEDAHTINKLKAAEPRKTPGNADKQCSFSKSALTDYVTSLAPPHGSALPNATLYELFDLLTPIWTAIREFGSGQSIEKRLVDHLDLKSVVSRDCHEVCENELVVLRNDLKTMSTNMDTLQTSLRNKQKASEETRSHEVNFTGSKDPSKLEAELKEAQEHIQRLRSQNLATLLELGSLKKSMHSKLTAAHDDAGQRLAQTASLHEAQLDRIESEARRFREETRRLLVDREEEIAELRNALSLPTTGGGGAFQSPPMVVRHPSLSSSVCDQEPDSSTAILSEEIPAHCGLVHCAERHGRMVIELKRLRWAKNDLEKQIGKLQAKSREDRRALQEASQSDGVTSRDPPAEANLAYVKNVVLNLLSTRNGSSHSSSSSISSRTAMVKALVMALKCSRDEESALMEGVI